MKKLPPKKLALTTETIRQLANTELRPVVGGYTAGCTEPTGSGLCTVTAVYTVCICITTPRASCPCYPTGRGC